MNGLATKWLTMTNQLGGSVSLWEVLNSVGNIVLFIFFLAEGIVQIQIERMINAILVTPIHFTGFEKQETSNGTEYLFYGSNYINYYCDVHENVTSSYYKNIPDIKTCHDRIGDRIWKREIIVTEVKNANESRIQGQGLKRG